jgi:hypothetical protein
MGRSLFIPIFFVVTGFLIKPDHPYLRDFRQLLARCLHHRCPARRQVNSRLAHDTLGAAGQRLLDDRMLNVVLLLVFATSVRGTPRYYQLVGRQFPEIVHHSQQTAQIAIAALR